MYSTKKTGKKERTIFFIVLYCPYNNYSQCMYRDEHYFIDI